MSTSIGTTDQVPWWKEPTKDQWYAYIAAWLGWTLDAFDFTIFLLIMVPIAQEFNVPLTAVAAVFTITLWLRLVGATAAGWMADRMGRKWPLMISIFWYSICNFIAGFSPTFAFLFFWRALLGIGMGAEWPAGAALAMESWPARSRGLMSGLLQGSWGLGFALSATAYALLYDHIGWRGLLIIGVLPALVCVWIRFYVKEPEVWAENKAQQAAEQKEVHLPLLMIFKPDMLWNTLTACVWMAAAFCVYYSIWVVWQPYLRSELKWTPGMIWWGYFFGNIIVVGSSAFWGYISDQYGRRWSIIIPAVIGVLLTPIYLTSSDFIVVTSFFIIQQMFAGSIYGQNPSYLSERFPTEVRATASGFVYHQGAIFGGMVAPILTQLATGEAVRLPDWLGGIQVAQAGTPMGFATPMMYGTMIFLVLVVIAVFLGPETRGKILTSRLEVK